MFQISPPQSEKLDQAVFKPDASRDRMNKHLLGRRRAKHNWLNCAFPSSPDASGAAALVEDHFLWKIRPNSGSVYPLRAPALVRFFPAAGGCQTRGDEAFCRLGLRGEGPTKEAAVRALGDILQMLVQEHHRVPPHRQDESSRAIAVQLNNLIDWDLYARLNPIEQPLWGKVVRRQADGSTVVFWFLGPGDLRNQEASLPPSNGSSRLLSFKEGEWFYGAGKAFPHRIQWTRSPVSVPDPNNPKEARRAWDRIPPKVLDDLESWPELPA